MCVCALECTQICMYAGMCACRHAPNDSRIQSHVGSHAWNDLSLRASRSVEPKCVSWRLGASLSTPVLRWRLFGPQNPDPRLPYAVFTRPATASLLLAPILPHATTDFKVPPPRGIFVVVYRLPLHPWSHYMSLIKHAKPRALSSVSALCPGRLSTRRVAALGS